MTSPSALSSPMEVERYLTPEGSLDFPFTYVFNATGLTDGTNQQNLTVQIEGDSDFVLRRIVGVNDCVDTPANSGKFNYKNASGSYANGGQSTGIIIGPNWVVLPEKKYPSGGQIYFDLFAIKRAAITGGGGACAANPILSSYIGFAVVKRFGRNRGYPTLATRYKYREVRYSYEYALTISQGFFTVAGGSIQSALARQVIPLDNYDFELLQIAVSKVTTPAGQTGTLTTNDFQVLLYDANMHQLSSAPMNVGWINAGKPTPATQNKYQGACPVPSIVYPAGGNIVFDVQSLLCAGDVPITYNMSFQGIWRIPCS